MSYWSPSSTQPTSTYSRETYDPHPGDSILHTLTAGMVVYDRHHLELGRIASVYCKGTYPKFDSQLEDDTQHVTPTIAGTFVGDQRVPELLFVKLGRTGFVQVQPLKIGIVRMSYYVTPAQIDSVDDNSVYLKVIGENVIKT